VDILPLRKLGIKPPPDAVDTFAVQRRVLASSLTPSAKVLLLAILSHARYGANPAGCFASSKVLGEETQLCERQVRRLFLDLEAGDWITIERAGKSKLSYKTARPGKACIVASAPGHGRPGASDAPGHPGRAPGHPGQESDLGCPSKRLVKRGEEKDSRFAPIQGMQNCNPPTPPVPDDDPAATAAMLARGFWPGSPRKGGAK
jgi:hypothetical protein